MCVCVIFTEKRDKYHWWRKGKGDKIQRNIYNEREKTWTKQEDGMIFNNKWSLPPETPRKHCHINRPRVCVIKQFTHKVKRKKSPKGKEKHLFKDTRCSRNLHTQMVVQMNEKKENEKERKRKKKISFPF